MKILAGKEKECTVEVIEWLHEVWLLKEAGRPIQPDPFYARTGLLTAEIVDKVISDLEGIFTYELEKYPAYHKGAQGVSESEYLAPPGFDKMTPTEQLAVVQGVDRAMQQFRAPDDQPAPVPSPYSWTAPSAVPPGPAGPQEPDPLDYC
jgi:hypothetical protein